MVTRDEATSESSLTRNVPDGDPPVVKTALRYPIASSVVDGTPVELAERVVPRVGLASLIAVDD